MFETIIVNPSNFNSERSAIRFMPDAEFIENKASGTLRKNSKLGMRHKEQLSAERLAYEFGYNFESATSSRITFNDAMTMCDCKPLTECGWFAERFITLQKTIFPEDEYMVKYMILEEEDGSRREGVALMVKKTSYPHLKPGRVIFCLMAKYDTTKKEYLKAVNPF